MMRKIMDELISLDLYAIPINLRIGKRISTSSPFSIVISKITFALILIFLIISLLSMFKGSNLQVKSQKIDLVSREKFEFNSDSFLFLFRIEDDDSNPRFLEDFDEYFEISIVQRSFSLKENNNSQSRNWVKSNRQKELNYSLCTLDKFNNVVEFQKQALMKSFCIDTNNITIEGFWDENIVEYIDVELFTCQNRTNKDKKPCKTQEEIENKLKSEPFLFSTYIQNYNLDPYDLKNPVKYSIKNFYTYLDLKISKSKYFYFKLIESLTDQSYIWPIYQSQKVYQQTQGSIDINTRDNDEKSLINVYIYSADEKEIVQISNEHILNIFTQLGGFAKFLISFGVLITFNYNTMVQEEELVNEIYSFDLEKKKKNEDFELINRSIEKIFKPRISSVSVTKKEKNEQNKEKKDINKEKNDLLNEIKKINFLTRNKSDINLNVNNIQEIIIDSHNSEKKIIKLEKKFEHSKSKKSILKKKLSEIKKIEEKSEKIVFSFIQKVKNVIFPCFCKEKSTRNLILYNKSVKLLRENLNILKYLKQNQEIEKLKFILLNKSQLALFNFIAKPLISDQSNLEDWNLQLSKRRSGYIMQNLIVFLNDKDELIQEILNYYDELLENKEFSDMDRKLFGLLDDSIKKLLFSEKN